MKPLQALLTWVSYELSVGLVVRDFEPLALAPLDEKLGDAGLHPRHAFAALRQAIRNSLRVLRVALASGSGLPGLPPSAAGELANRMAVVGKPRNLADAALDCHVALERCDEIFAFDDLDEDLLYQTMAYSDAILSPRAMDMQAGYASSYLLDALRARLGETAPLVGVLERRDLLREGVLYFFIDALRAIPAVGAMLDHVAATDAAGVTADVGSRRDRLAAKLAAETGSDLKRQVLSERISGLENLELTIRTQLAIAHSLVALRAEFKALVHPVVDSLDTLFRGLEEGASSEAPAPEGDVSSDDAAPPEEDTTDRYAMPLEDLESSGDATGVFPADAAIPNDPQLVFKLATTEFMGGNYNKAIRLFNRTIDLDPTMAPAHFNLSQAYLRRGRWANALASYQQAVFCDSRLRMAPPEFEIEEILGAGGMGILFRVNDTKRNRPCTARVIKPSLTAQPERLARLVNGLKDLRKVESPAILRSFDLRKFKNHHLLFSEYAPGTSLRQILEMGPIPPRAATALLRQIVECVQQAHEEDVVHNHLVPSCLFVHKGEEIKIGDFALMGLVGDDPSELAPLGMATEYLAPEQESSLEPSMPADVFAIAMIYYEMIFGARWQPGLSFPEGGGSGVDPALAQMLNAGTSPSPPARPTAGDLLVLLRELAPGQQTRSLRLDLSSAPTAADGPSFGAPTADESAVPSEVRTPAIPSPPPRVTPTPEPGRRFQGPPPGMSLIPAGAFGMGHDEDPGASPCHEIHLDAYYIDTCAVTNRQYREFLAKTGHKAPHVEAPWAADYNWKKGIYPAGTDDHPVVLVNWYEAAAYAKFVGKRLPTEAEWERAARGDDGRVFPWGHAFDAKRATHLRSEHRIGPVDAHPDGASPYGCLGMAGNVWEWVEDWYDKAYYTRATPQNPTGPRMGKDKVIRGGAFDSLEEALRTHYRFHHPPRQPSYYIGFRLAVSASQVD